MPVGLTYPPQGLVTYKDLGSLDATCYVIASDAKAEVKRFAQILQASGYPVWVTDGVEDDEEIQAAVDSLPALGALYYSGRGKIRLMGRTFNLAHRVTSSPKVTFEGDGMQATQITGVGHTQWDSFDAVGSWVALRGDETLSIDNTVKAEGTGSLKIIGGTIDYPGAKVTGLASLDWSDKEGIEIIVRPDTITSGSINYIRLTIKDSAGNYEYFDEEVHLPARFIRLFFDLLNPTGSSGTLDWTDVTEVDIEARTTTDGFTFYIDDIGFNIMGFQMKYDSDVGEVGGQFSNMMLGHVTASKRLSVGIEVWGTQFVELSNILGYYCSTANLRFKEGSFFNTVSRCDIYMDSYGTSVWSDVCASNNPLTYIRNCNFHGGTETFAIINPMTVENNYFEMGGTGTSTYITTYLGCDIHGNTFTGNHDYDFIAVLGGKINCYGNSFNEAGDSIINFINSGDDSVIADNYVYNWNEYFIRIVNAKRLKITGNEVYNSKATGAVTGCIAHTSSYDTLGTSVKDNTFYFVNPQNIKAYNEGSFYSGTFDNNEVRGCGGAASIKTARGNNINGVNAAVVLNEGIYGFSAYSNRVVTLGAMGIGVREQAVGNQISGCTNGIELATNDVQVVGNTIRSCSSYGINAESRTGVFIANNKLVGNTTPMNLLNATGIIRNNTGYVTENSGTTTIASGQTSVTVNHGLATTPTRVVLTPTTDTAGRRFWVSAKGATTFTITIDSTHTADISFDWRAQIGEG